MLFDLFTFQSGYIQMGNATDYSYIYNIFTFQSGYIQMIDTCSIVVREFIIYIPIWLYSNVVLSNIIFNYC